MYNVIQSAGWAARFLEFQHNIYIYVLYALIIIAAGWTIKGIETLVKRHHRKRIEKGRTANIS